MAEAMGHLEQEVTSSRRPRPVAGVADWILAAIRPRYTILARPRGLRGVVFPTINRWERKGIKLNLGYKKLHVYLTQFWLWDSVLLLKQLQLQTATSLLTLKLRLRHHDCMKTKKIISPL